MPNKSPKINVILPLSKNRRYLIGAFGFCLGVFGLLYGLFWEIIFNCLVEKALVLRPDTKMFELWRAPPLTLTLDVYLYNWTNPEDFDNHTIKPILQELGPYRFTEHLNKVDIQWHPENSSITYRKKNLYYFDAAGSKGHLDDQIVTFNSLAAAIATKTKHWSGVRRSFIELALKVYHNDISIKRTAKELLFDGFEDMLINVANVIPSSITNVIVPFDKFGYCYPRNGSAEYSGVFNMHTGAGDIRKLGQMHTWNYKTETSSFSPECAQVHGSPGELQPPNLKKNGTIDIFLTDFCRPITLDYEDSVNVEGVEGFKYSGGLRSVDNGTSYPENACYCNGDCVPSGVFNITSCWYGAPLFVSYPHFYNADPYYAQQVVGMKPQKKKHELYIVVEPKTGLALEVAGRFQANVLVEPLPHLKMFQKMRRVFFPLFWVEERVRITPDMAMEFKLLPMVVLGGQILGGICFAIGLILFFWYSVVYQLQKHLLQHIEINDMDKAPSDVGSKNDIAAPTTPLLGNGTKLHISILPKSISIESDRTITENLSTSPSSTSLSSG